MQIKRLLDGREVFAGDGVFGAQGRSYAFVEHSGGELVVTRNIGVLSGLSLNSWGAMSFT